MSRSKLFVVVSCCVAVACVNNSQWSKADDNASSADALRRKVTLVRTPKVQADLELSAEQMVAMRIIVDKIDLPLWQLRTAKAEQVSQRLPVMEKWFTGQLVSTLKAEQLQRLEQISWRSKGSGKLVQDADFIEKIGLTSSQQEKIVALLRSAQASSATSTSDSEQKIAGLFTSTQRERLSGLLGRSFDFSDVHEIGVHAPEIAGIEGWVNSQPLKLADLRGKVVVLTFWTFGCINCIHNLPIYESWYDDLPRDKVVLLGIHTPETAGEHDLAQLQQAVKKRGLKYPIAMDLHGKTWNVWGNDTWPATYVIDKQGDVRTWWTGELKWNGAQGDKIIRDRIEALAAEKEQKQP